jgi:hypothetical protein
MTPLWEMWSKPSLDSTLATTSSLGRRQVVAEGLRISSQRVASEHHAGPGVVATVSEHHRLDGDRSAERIRDVVAPAIPLGTLLRDEANLERLRSISNEAFNSVVWEAISFVVDATGEDSMHTWDAHGIHRLKIEGSETARIEERFGLEPLESSHPAAFVDREGMLNLPFQAAEALAMHIADKEPQAVLLFIKEHEEELLAAGYQPGLRHRHEILRRYQPAYALARQWAGLQGEAQLLTREIDRLRGIVSQAIWMPKEAGADSAARRLERALHGG